ncbi:MAG: protein kinase [Acidobacteriota bacterium]|nr:protein kinase [Acidobacteriota bacterium]
MSVAAPDSLLHFKIIEILGTGGNGTVYRARDTQSDEVVALKTLKNVSEVALSRFKREFLSLKKMDDPGIVRVYDGFFEHDPPFFSMEWVRGKTLSRMLKDMEDNPLIFTVADRENFALRLGVQVCDILSYVHSRGEVHRDLKPDNIFITLAGDNILSEFTVKMLDFGLLKQVNEQEAKDDSESGMIVGTVHYLSPEQAKGVNVDLRSDLYSLGVIMYKAICLKLPYEAKDVVGYIFKTVFEDPTPIEQQTDLCSEPMTRLLGEILAKDPSDRPPSAESLKRRMQKILNPVKNVALDLEVSDFDFSAGIEGFGSPLLPPPLTGRERAIQKMVAQTDRLVTTYPLAVVLEGEPGMGRSSVIKEWKSRIRFKKPVFLQAHFSEDLVPSQDPIGMLIDSVIRIMKPEEVKKAFKEVYPFLSSVSRYLGRYFDTKSVGRFDHLSPSRKLQVLAVNFIKLVRKLAEGRTVVMVLEDVNNAPERFFGWLTLFWEQLAGVPLMLVYSGSPDPSKAAFNQFRRRLIDHHETSEILLKPLTMDEACRLLQSMLPIGTDLPFAPKLQKLLMDRAGGNPFYTIELFTTLYDEDHLYISGGRLDVKSVRGVDVPLSIHQALLKKVSRLPKTSMLLVQTAATLGGVFHYNWLQRALNWPEEQFLKILDSLIKMGVLSEEVEPAHKLFFNAPALQKIVYEQIPSKQGREMHNRVAQAIEANLDNDDILSLEQVAHHYANGANYVRAVKYTYLAGNGALEAKEPEKAIYFFELSLAMMDKMQNKQARNLVNLKLAEVHLENQDPASALKYYDACLHIPNLSKMEELRALRGRMLCNQEMNRFADAYRDSVALCNLGKTCSNRIQAETLVARGHLAWLAEGDANIYRKDVLKANLLYPKLRDWPTNTAWAQILSNEVVEARKRLQDLAKKKYEPGMPLYLQLAAIRYFMGDFKKAQGYLNQSRVSSGSELAATEDPRLMVAHAMLTYKVNSTLAPDHYSEEYLSISRRYIERFGLEKMTVKIHLVKLEHFLMNARYEDAWKLVSELVETSFDLPDEFHDRFLFIALAMRAAWEMKERPPRGWLIQFQKYQPSEKSTFTLQTHWALAMAAESTLEFATGAPETLKYLMSVQQILLKHKLKYYYRALLLKEIALLKHMGGSPKLAQLEALKLQLDKSIDAKLPD